MNSQEKLKPEQHAILAAAATGESCDAVLKRHALVFMRAFERDLALTREAYAQAMLLPAVSCSGFAFTPRSQKARGIRELTSAGFDMPSAYLAQDPYILLGLALNLRKAEGDQLFIRPCPKTPRHGFMDSFVLQATDSWAWDDVQQLWSRLREADPHGEFLVMPYIRAQYNMVATQNAVAIGNGHDGATAGKASTVYPVSMVMPIPSGLNDTKEMVYIEAVVRPQGALLFTQMRLGPLQRKMGNYIPKRTEVTSVVLADGDGLAWEALMTQLPPGTVVHHPGGTRLSHYAVHAFLNGVPVIFDGVAPEVGAILDPSDEDGVGKASWSRAAYERGLAAGFSEVLSERGILYLCALVYFVHNMIGLAVRDAEAASFMVGYLSMIVLRYGTIACLGEARHMLSIDNSTSHRQRIYSDKLNCNYMQLRPALEGALWAFELKHGWGPSFGGPKWAACARALQDMELNLTSVLVDSDVQVAAMRLNRITSLAHNTGWWLNKFGNPDFNAVSKGELTSTLIAVLNYHKLVKKLSGIVPGVEETLMTQLAHDVSALKELPPLTPRILPYDDVNKTPIRQEEYSTLNELYDEGLHADKLPVMGCSCMDCIILQVRMHMAGRAIEVSEGEAHDTVPHWGDDPRLPRNAARLRREKTNDPSEKPDGYSPDCSCSECVAHTNWLESVDTSYNDNEDE